MADAKTHNSLPRREAINQRARSPTNPGQDRGVRMKVTRRQAEILELIGSGLSDKEVGRKLGVSQSTIRTHLRRLYRQHHVHSRAEAVVEWLAERTAPDRKGT